MPYVCQFCATDVPDGYTHVHAVFAGAPTCYEIDRETLKLRMAKSAERPTKEIAPISVSFADRRPPSPRTGKFGALGRILNAILRPELRA